MTSEARGTFSATGFSPEVSVLGCLRAGEGGKGAGRQDKGAGCWGSESGSQGEEVGRGV